jgi:hypothetical protein
MRKGVKYILAGAAIIFMCGGAGAEEAAAPDSVTPMTWDDCVKEAAKAQAGAMYEILLLRRKGHA